MKAKKVQATMKIVPTVLFLMITSGCTSTTERQYAPFIRDLDGLSELEISTYPADYPTRLSEKGAVFKKYESSDELYFQIFIRDKKKQIGVDPHVDSITIHSFSYQIADNPPEVLLSEYRDNFWMQGNPRYETRKLPPIPYLPGGKISIKISFTLNNNKFTFVGEMAATKKYWILPTFIHNQGV